MIILFEEQHLIESQCVLLSSDGSGEARVSLAALLPYGHKLSPEVLVSSV